MSNHYYYEYINEDGDFCVEKVFCDENFIPIEKPMTEKRLGELTLSEVASLFTCAEGEALDEFSSEFWRLFGLEG